MSDISFDDFFTLPDNTNSHLGKKCHFCDSPNPYPDLPVCDNHRLCIHCLTLMTTAEITHNIEMGDLPQHARCLVLHEHKRVSLESSNDFLKVSRKYFDYLNRCRMMVEPDTKLNKQSNQLQATLAQARNVVDMTLDEKFLHMCKIEAIVAECRIVLIKDKEAIKLSLDKRDSEKFDKALETRKRMERVKVDKSASAGGTFVAQERVKLTQEQKLIKDMRKLLPGLSDEAILGIVKAQQADSKEN